ncbi:MAG: TrmJ/YjtD family RNA methyltransferase [Thermodesulfovibrionales bacterium]
MKVKRWQDNITFILVETEEQGNIGASARAIFNMGFQNLALVNPPSITSEAYWFAHNAEEVLDRCQIYDDLNQALIGKSVIACTTRRYGRKRGLFVSPSEGSQMIYDAAKAGKVAILFGRESKGLENDEINECGLLITIPSSKKAPSLNLSHAVLLIAYEIMKYDLFHSKEDYNYLDGHDSLVYREDQESIIERLREVLDILGYGQKGTIDMKEKIITNFRRMFRRGGLTRWEADMFSGLLSRIDEMVRGR